MSSTPREPRRTLRHRLVGYYVVDGESPEAIRRPMRWSLVVPGLGLLGLVTLVALDATGVVARPYPAATVSIVGVTFACVWLCHRIARRALRRAAAADHLLCPACAYDLRALDDVGACPECGRA